RFHGRWTRCRSRRIPFLVRRRTEIAPEASEFSRKQETARTTLEEEVAELYHATSASLRRYALLLLPNRGLAQDAVQEAFLKYYVARMKGEARPLSRAWLFRRVRDYICGERDSVNLDSYVALNHALGKPDHRPSPENALVQSEIIEKAL